MKKQIIATIALLMTTALSVNAYYDNDDYRPHTYPGRTVDAAGNIVEGTGRAAGTVVEGTGNFLGGIFGGGRERREERRDARQLEEQNRRQERENRLRERQQQDQARRNQ